MSEKYRLPESFVEKHLEKAKGCTMFGEPIEALSRDELIAVCMCGWEAHSEALAEADRQLELLEDTYKSTSKSLFETFCGGVS